MFARSKYFHVSLHSKQSSVKKKKKKKIEEVQRRETSSYQGSTLGWTKKLQQIEKYEVISK